MCHACNFCLLLRRPVDSLYLHEKAFSCGTPIQPFDWPSLEGVSRKTSDSSKLLAFVPWFVHGVEQSWKGAPATHPIVSPSNCRTCSGRSDENTIEYLKIVNQGLPDAKKFIRRVLSSTQIFIKKDAHTQVGQFLRARADEFQFDEEDNLEEQD